MTDDRLLSELLWDSRETASMYADVVQVQTRQNPKFLRELVARIDEYRASRGWDPHGFGNED